MSTWTRLAYGTLAAGALLGGVSIYHGASRSIVLAVDVADLIEAVNERSAAVSSWPWTTNSSDAGWGYGYVTNVPGSVRWSFMDFRLSSSPLIRLIPLIGGSMSGRAVNECLRQTKALVPKFSSGIAVDAYGWPEAVGLTVTGVWADLGIGDGTSRWTVGYTTNGLPIYDNAVGMEICTTTLHECWAVLNVFTQSTPNTTRTWQSNETIRVLFGAEKWNLTSYEPDGNPNGESIVQEMNHYEVSSDWGTNAFESSPLPFEAWSAIPLFYSYFEKWTDTEGNVILRTNTLYSGSYSWTPRISADRSRSIYALGFPTFPSGVVAEVQFFYRVSGNWSLKGGGVVDTNLTILGVSTSQPTSIQFMTDLSTNIYTNVTILAEAAVTNWVPPELRSVDHTLIFDKYSAWTNGLGVMNQSWRWKGTEAYSSPYFAFGGRLEAYAPVALVKWTWIYKKEEAE